jgi:hypothetical protein
MDDAAVIQEVRRRVGRQIDLRADANRGWTFEEAIQFSSFVKHCDLQYIEVYSLSMTITVLPVMFPKEWIILGILD